MKSATIFFIIIAVFFCSLHAQITLNGIVEESGTGEPLAFVSVFNSPKKRGVLTNDYGFFSITLPPGEQKLDFALSGYQRFLLEIRLIKDTTVKIYLSPYQTQTDTVLITDENENRMAGIQISRNILPVRQIEKMPMLMGEGDIMKAIQLLPGVQFGKEGTAGLYVRGGSPDQNLILLDDIPVYNVNHLFGFASLFPPSSLKSAELYKGGFPAEYGGRLSSVIKLQTREGNLNQRQTKVSLGTISGHLITEGPIAKGKSSYFFAGRRTWIDALVKPATKLIYRQEGVNGSLGYGFYDLIGKINFVLSEKDRLYLSFYVGQDKGGINLEGVSEEDTSNIVVGRVSTLQWGNLTGSLRYHRILTPKWFMRTTLGYTHYQFNTLLSSTQTDKNHQPPEITQTKISFLSSISDLLLKQTWDYYPDSHHNIHLGVSATQKNFRPDVRISEVISSGMPTDTAFQQDRFNSVTLAFFIEDEFKPTARWLIRGGLRGEWFYAPEISLPSLQPRLAIRYSISEKSNLNFAWSYIRQYLHLLTNSGLGLPSDLWVPATANVPPAASHQWIIGWDGNGPWDTRLSAEVYYKSLHNIIEYKDGASFYNSFESWENKVESGRGNSYGIEFFAEKMYGKWSGWASYTLSRADRQFPTLNAGNSFPYRYDRRHNFSTFLSYQLPNPNKVVSATWMYVSGARETIPEGIHNTPSDFLTGNTYGGVGPIVTFADSRNNYQIRPFHKLDLSWQHSKVKKRYTRIWNIGIYNLYGRKNPYYIYYERQSRYDPLSGTSRIVSANLIERSFLLWLPYVTYSMEF